MKILILSDLHLSYQYIRDTYLIEKIKRTLENNIKNNYDLVVISGDVFETSIMKYKCNPYQILEKLFNGKTVVFCLGNHEFAYKNYNDVIDYYYNQQIDNNVFCLDICNKVLIDKINFVGNVFWYDFSLNQNRMLMKGEIIDGWLDKTIDNFDPIQYNQENQNKILSNLSTEYNNIVITHTVPHWSLNTFSIEEPYSIYNAYSGCKDFLKKLENKNIEYYICGHTHRREIKEIYGIKCINIGNDYFFKTNKIENMIIKV